MNRAVLLPVVTKRTLNRVTSSCRNVVVMRYCPSRNYHHQTRTYTTSSASVLSNNTMEHLRIEQVNLSSKRFPIEFVVVVAVACTGLFLVLSVRGLESNVDGLLHPPVDVNVEHVDQVKLNTLQNFVRRAVCTNNSSIPLIDLAGSSTHDLHRMVLVNQQDPNREVDMILIDAKDEQIRLKGRESDLQMMFLSFELVSKWKSLKGTSRPIVIIYSGPHHFENELLDIVRGYSGKWYSDFNRYNLAIVFADSSKQWRFITDNVRRMTI